MYVLSVRKSSQDYSPFILWNVVIELPLLNLEKQVDKGDADYIVSKNNTDVPNKKCQKSKQ